MKKKIFIASGCSFTFEPWNWPTFVAKYLGAELINVGMASQGNGLIAKKAIYTVNKHLKTTDPDDIMVGIMWSGIDRFNFHVDNYPYVKGKGSPGNVDGWIENPTNVIDGDNKNWLITNIGWKVRAAELWYKNFHTHTGAMVHTLERILYTQWFLEKMGVDYFMTTFMDILTEPLISEPESEYLYKMIDFSKFLPIKGCYEWIENNCDVKRALGVPDDFGRPGIHPTEFGHEIFAKRLIIPHISGDNKTRLI